MPAPKFLLTFAFAALSFGVQAVRAQDFNAAVKDIVAKTGPATLAVQGADPHWFFLRRELEHLALGDLAALDLAMANKERTDPLPVIVQYQEALKALGVELLLVPVPPKAAIYPEKLLAGATPDSPPSLLPFYAKLRAAGIEVLDLETVFKNQRAEHPDKQLYCATDSHWSPYAAQLAADLVAAKYRTRPGVVTAPQTNFKVLPEEPLEFHGDLLTDEQKAAALAKEKLPMQRAGVADPANPQAVTTVTGDSKSPLLVIGDSHLQVFRRGGNMLATQGGFIDHLQAALGTAVEEVSMQAGGADGPRLNIARETAKTPEFWSQKKAVVWVFTAREFTQGKWRVLPARVPKK